MVSALGGYKDSGTNCVYTSSKNVTNNYSCEEGYTLSGAKCIKTEITDAEKVALYSKRYFMVKWYFVMTHPDLCNLKMFDILRQDYDQRTEEIRYLTERKIRNPMSYTMGSIILSPVKKLFNIFKK